MNPDTQLQTQRRSSIHGELLEDYLHQHALTLDAFASKAGIDRRTLGRALAAQPVDRRIILRIAKAMGVEPADLVAKGSTRPALAGQSPAGASMGVADPGGPRPHNSALPPTGSCPAPEGVHLAQCLRKKPWTLVLGDRRAPSVHRASDLLRNLGWIDCARLAGFGHPILSDILVADDWAMDRPPHHLLSAGIVTVGAPDVNFATFLANSEAIFRFLIDDVHWYELLRHARNVGRLSVHEREAYAHQHRGELATVHARLSPNAFFDPFGAAHPRPKELGQCGVVTLAQLPGYPGCCVVAAGVSGAGTAGALALLSGARIRDPHAPGTPRGLESRPVGGVFLRRDSQRWSVPEDILHVEDDLEWVTPAYDLGQLRSALAAVQPSPDGRGPTRNDLNPMLELVGSFARSDAAGQGVGGVPRRAVRGAERACTVIVPTGGQGTRMHEVTQRIGVRSKLDLPVGAHTVLQRVTRAWIATERVREVLYLSSDELAEHQADQARKAFQADPADPAASDTGVCRARLMPCVVSQGRRSLDEAMLDELGQRLALGWVVVAQGDTLIPTSSLARFLAAVDEAEQRGLEAVVAVIDVPSTQARIYGIVAKQGPGVRIVEKPSLAGDVRAFTGVLALSPRALARITERRRHTDREVPQTWTDVALGGAPALIHDMSPPMWDCGSPSGYASAAEAVAEIDRLWEGVPA